MNSTEIYFKIVTGLNKLDSSDYQNVQTWIIQQEYNKARIDLIREQLNGINAKREGKTGSVLKVSDLQVLLKSDKLSGANRDVYFLTQSIPKDFLEESRLTPFVVTESCDTPVQFTSDLIEDENVNEYLGDYSKQPSYEFEQCFHTIGGNRYKVYHNKQFEVKETELSYYRIPTFITFAGAETPTGQAGKEMDEEFHNDVVELFVERTIQNISADIENVNRYQVAKQNLSETI